MSPCAYTLFFCAVGCYLMLFADDVYSIRSFYYYCSFHDWAVFMLGYFYSAFLGSKLLCPLVGRTPRRYHTSSSVFPFKQRRSFTCRVPDSLSTWRSAWRARYALACGHSRGSNLYHSTGGREREEKKLQYGASQISGTSMGNTFCFFVTNPAGWEILTYRNVDFRDNQRRKRLTGLPLLSGDCCTVFTPSF